MPADARDPSPLPPLPVSVRALCEFAAREGDLDLRFAAAPSGVEGVRGHQQQAGRKAAAAPDYQRELALEQRWGRLLIRGRADGWDPGARRLDEVKTLRGPPERRVARMAASTRALHWAQAEVYGWMLATQQGLDRLTLALVYVDIGSPGGRKGPREARLLREISKAELDTRVARWAAAYQAWALAEQARRQQRDVELGQLAFPLAFRPGQRELAAAVYHAASRARCLLAQAPTGIGKTLGTVYPALRALPAAGIDRLAYLTAKTSGRALALGGLAQLRPGAPALRVIELVARDKACEHPDKACHGASCPLARGFWDRLPAARTAACALPVWDKPALRTLALDHRLCPYHLGQALTPWADVAVGDFNHWFDLHAGLHGLHTEQGLRTTLLVDEAHNLVERARAMYSARFEPTRLQALRPQLPAAVKREATKVLRLCATLRAAHPALEEPLPQMPEGLVEALEGLQNALLDHLVEDVGGEPEGDRASGEGSSADWHPAPALGPSMPLDNVTTRQVSLPLLPFADLVNASPGGGDGAGPGDRVRQGRQPRTPLTAADLQTLLFDTLAFTALAPSFGPHAVLVLSGRAEAPALVLRNLCPAPHLQPRFAAAQGVSLFSATLGSPDYQRRLLGLPADHGWLDLPSPFDPAHLQVELVPWIDTRQAGRSASLPALVDLIGRHCQTEPGNYLACFSSYDYLAQAAALLAERWPGLTLWPQARGMSEGEQAGFLARFVEGGQGLGLVVLGGSFAEGIDLPGTRLVGVFVATLGLPSFDRAHALLGRRLGELFADEPEAGWRYASLIPGLQKVVQAAGRVIRSASDRGRVWLIDPRYTRREVRALLPAWWQVAVRPAPALGEALTPAPADEPAATTAVRPV